MPIIFASAMLIYGALIITRARYKVSPTYEVTGGRARIIGGVFLGPFPCLLLIEFVYRIIFSSKHGHEPNILDYGPELLFINFGTIALFVAIAIILALIWKQPIGSNPSPPDSTSVTGPADSLAETNDPKPNSDDN